jgi:hypothetical protein
MKRGVRSERTHLHFANQRNDPVMWCGAVYVVDNLVCALPIPSMSCPCVGRSGPMQWRVHRGSMWQKMQSDCAREGTRARDISCVEIDSISVGVKHTRRVIRFFTPAKVSVSARRALYTRANPASSSNGAMPNGRNLSTSQLKSPAIIISAPGCCALMVSCSSVHALSARPSTSGSDFQRKCTQPNARGSPSPSNEPTRRTCTTTPVFHPCSWVHRTNATSIVGSRANTASLIKIATPTL